MAISTSAMSSTSLPSTLNFLTDAGHLLATSAPETSAYLMNRRNRLLFDNELPQSDVQKQHVCGCCGQIMIASDGTTLKVESAKAIRKKKTARGPKSARTNGEKTGGAGGAGASGGQQPRRTSGPSKVITCGRCASFTTIKFPPPAPISRRAKTRKTIQQPEASAAASRVGQDSEQQRKPSANASSKKRAKTRKGGLQSTLR